MGSVGVGNVGVGGVRVGSVRVGGVGVRSVDENGECRCGSGVCVVRVVSMSGRGGAV